MTTTRMSVSSRVNSDRKLHEAETVPLGVNVPKASDHVAVLSDQRVFIAIWTHPADPDLLLARLKPIRPQVAQIVRDAGHTGFTR